MWDNYVFTEVFADRMIVIKQSLGLLLKISKYLYFSEDVNKIVLYFIGSNTG